ncbi:sugar transferase [Methylosinus sp. R-45379]|uniref:sugar transferase n=1 Tax=Methylosinus sp. R-45379 TaxID=980563 RepID=UPI0007C92078|nr:sugar transferase [Methylosinus sp. R-45379]OAI28671.1 sugar transferase [Methylosinus sp. R-45379]
MRVASPASRDRIAFRLQLADIGWATAAPFIALALRDPQLLEAGDLARDLPAPYRYAFLSIACTLLVMWGFRLSDRMGQFFSLRDAVDVCVASACAVASSSVVLFTLTRLEGVPRSTPLIYVLVLAAGLIAIRGMTRLHHREVWRRELETDIADPSVALRRVILIGVDRFASVAIKLIDYQLPRTTQIVAALDARPSFVGRKVGGVSIVALPQDIGAVLDEYAEHGVEIDEVWLADDKEALPAELLKDVAAQCDARGRDCVPIAEALNLAPRQARPETPLGGPPDGRFDTPDYFGSKRVIDLLATSLLLVFAVPTALIVACAILIDVGAPIVFWQQRVGRNGERFFVYKFRTFRPPFDRHGRRVPKERRLSRIGRAIRAARLDEIPQLYNVIIGHMSLIGPRPLLPVDQPADPRRRLSVRPGVTGWAQIKGGTLVTPEEKNALDVWYIRHASWRLDLAIVFGTLAIAFTGERLNRAAVDHATGWYRREFEGARGRAETVGLRPQGRAKSPTLAPGRSI